jgi:nucleoid-associated protein YgaU
VGSVAQAVLEFDEAVQAPWRPRLAEAAPAGAASRGLHGASRALRAVPSAGGLPTTSAPSRGHRPRAGGPRPRSRTAAPCYRGAPVSGQVSVAGARIPARRAAGRRPVPVRRPPLRLTRRARRLVAVLVLGAGIAAGSWVGALVAGGDGGLRLAGESSVVVRAGDSLWSIASAVAGDADVREVVDRIQSINDLDGSALQPGQVLRLP